MDFQFPRQLFPTFYNNGPPTAALKQCCGKWGSYDRVLPLVAPPLLAPLSPPDILALVGEGKHRHISGKDTELAACQASNLTFCRVIESNHFRPAPSRGFNPFRKDSDFL